MDLQQILDITSLPIIVTIVHLVLRIYKDMVEQNITITKRELYIKIIPIIAAFLGLGLGIVGFFMGIVGQSIITASLIGLISGLSATGVDQLIKQIINNK